VDAAYNGGHVKRQPIENMTLYAERLEQLQALARKFEWSIELNVPGLDKA
jgi:hypothetical protein